MIINSYFVALKKPTAYKKKWHQASDCLRSVIASGECSAGSVHVVICVAKHQHPSYEEIGVLFVRFVLVNCVQYQL